MLPRTIGTHSGAFHADEVVGVMLLTNFTKEFKNAKVTRSRDMNILKDLDLILDVGNEYDPARHRYDHHQKGFMETFSKDFSTKLSSSGLIYKHFGKEILQNAISYLFEEGQMLEPKWRVEIGEEDIDEFYVRLYTDFFEYLDAIDNGIKMYVTDLKPRYKHHYNDLVSRVGRLNSDDFSPKPVSEEEGFQRALILSKEEFLVEVKYAYIDSFVGIPIVKKAIEDRFSVHPSGKIIKLERTCSWKSALLRLEEKMGIKDGVEFVLFQDRGEGGFRVQTVPLQPRSFEFRRGLHADFRGLRDAELQKITGLPSAVFVHVTGFIGGCKTYEDALKMAELSLNSP